MEQAPDADREKDVTQFLLEILDTRHDITEAIERSPNGESMNSYENIQVADLTPPEALQFLLPRHLTTAQMSADFYRNKGGALVLKKLAIQPEDAGAVQITHDNGMYAIEAGAEFYLEDNERLARQCLELCIPADKRRQLVRPSIEQLSGYFASLAPSAQERRVFEEVTDNTVHFVMAHDFETIDDSIQRLEIARLEHDGIGFTGTRLVLEESLTRRMNDTSGDKLQSAVYIDKVMTENAHEVAGKLTSIEQLFSGTIESIPTMQIDYDHMSDILDTLSALEQSSTPKPL